MTLDEMEGSEIFEEDPNLGMVGRLTQWIPPDELTSERIADELNASITDSMSRGGDTPATYPSRDRTKPTLAFLQKKLSFIVTGASTQRVYDVRENTRLTEVEPSG